MVLKARKTSGNRSVVGRMATFDNNNGDILTLSDCVQIYVEDVFPATTVDLVYRQAVQRCKEDRVDF